MSFESGFSRGEARPKHSARGSGGVAATAPGFGWPKAARLLRRAQFLALSRRSVPADLTIKTGSFLIVGRLNGLERTRLGVTVTKKVGGAVLRNRLKRQAREFFRLQVNRWPAGLDLVFIARQGAAPPTRAQVAADLARAGKKLAAWRPPAPGADRPGGSRPAGGSTEPAVEAEPRADETSSGPKSQPRPDRSSLSVGCSIETAGMEAPPPDDRQQSVLEAVLAPLADFWGDLQRGLGWLALGFIRFYQYCISPLLPPACRFRPTCSSYAAQAIQIHGFWRGAGLAAWRLLKCHPFHPGGYDPVPPRRGANSRRG